MLSKLVIRLKKEEGLNQNIGSVLQGIIMEKIDAEYAAKLHSLEINPYSQSIRIEEGHMEWIICTMTKEARDRIIVPILTDVASTIKLKNRDLELRMLHKSVEDMPYETLMDATYFGQCPSYLKLRFESPTAFKVAGRYQNYPTINHIFQSLIRKYDEAAGQSKIFSEELLQQIDEHTYITQYNLHSTFFHLEGIKIPAFKGTITIKMNGPQMFLNLMHMLAEFGEFSGTGIKTAIGMGRTKVVKKEERV